MEFIFSNSNRQKKSYRDKNSKLVDKKISQHAAQSDSEFYNTATSVASAPVANLRRDKSKRAAQVNFLGFETMWNPRDVHENRVFGLFKNFEICSTSDRFIGIQRPLFDQFFEHQMALGSEIVRKCKSIFPIKQRLKKCEMTFHHVV